MKKIIAANWKMTLQKENLAPLVEVVKQANLDELETIICPSFTHLSKVANLIENTSIKLGAQDCFWEEKGAYTGEVSAWDLKNEGCQFVLVGHSERRRYFAETDEIINKKLLASLVSGLTPILCVGETKAEKDAGQTLTRVAEQLKNDLIGVAARKEQIIIAYEPVWAIGTGDSCSPEIAAQIHSLIKQEVKKDIGIEDVIVLYGGSVDDKNVNDFLRQNFVDGVLVGGASTKVEVFSKLLANSI